MQRILEPEYMDTVDEADSYDAMDHTAANESFVGDFLALGGGQGRHLDLGTGPGHIPILLAQRAEQATVVAIDAAQHMLDLARTKVRAAQLDGRIELRRADAKQLPFADGEFDAVFSNTILHHIPDPEPFLAEAYRVLRGGGTLMIRDLVRPDTEDQAWALVDKHAVGATERQRQLFYDSLHAALTLDEIRALVQRVGIDGATVEMTSDRHYTIGLRPH